MKINPPRLCTKIGSDFGMFEARTLFLLETCPNQTQFLSTGAVVDFSSVAPVSKNRPRCEHSSNEIATFGNDPASVSKNLALEAWLGQ